MKKLMAGVLFLMLSVLACENTTPPPQAMTLNATYETGATARATLSAQAPTLSNTAVTPTEDVVNTPVPQTSHTPTPIIRGTLSIITATPCVDYICVVGPDATRLPPGVIKFQSGTYTPYAA